MDILFSRLESTIQKYGMLRPGERLLVACSSGADSMALFYLLKEMAPHYRLKLALIHFDHSLRKHSRRDLEFVRALAKKYHLPFYGERAEKTVRSKNLSPEEKARKQRYEFFYRVAKQTKIRKIALAHHRDDQAETVLMRLLQGTGLRGLQGIRPVVKMEGVTFIRPLMGVTRAELREFLKNRRLKFREDYTNLSRRFLRNRIRHQLLPLLEREFNPKIRDILSRLAETVNSELEGMDQWVQEKWQVFLSGKANGMVRLDRGLFLLLPEALQFRLLDQVVHVLDPHSGLNAEAWEKFKTGRQKGRFRLTLPRRIDLQFSPTAFFLRKIT